MRAHVWMRVFFAKKKKRKKLGTDAKDGSAATKRGSAKMWLISSYLFCHAECTQS
jgi:hypothetical protein